MMRIMVPLCLPFACISNCPCNGCNLDYDVAPTMQKCKIPNLVLEVNSYHVTLIFAMQQQNIYKFGIWVSIFVIKILNVLFSVNYVNCTFTHI